MNSSIYAISIPRLLIALLPLIFLIALFWRWSLKPGEFLYASARMLLQLTAIGFVLTFIFKEQNIYIISSILLLMLTMASWISLRPIAKYRKKYLLSAFVSLAVIGSAILALIIFVIIKPNPWYKPTYLIPLAGMLFSNSMNILSLSAERFFKERQDGRKFHDARKIAMKTGLIPLTNSFFAVGLVSLPGMMTGQILAGVDPLIAVRYQILVMATLFASGGLVSALFITLAEKKNNEKAA